MYIEAVREKVVPTNSNLVRDFMKIECRQCTAAYHLYHDGAGLNVLGEYFLRASLEISREHPDHRRVIVLEPHSSAVNEQAS
jgi:hypothetical protein